MDISLYKEDKAMSSKTIIFSFDGTGNEPSDSKSYTEDESISNILKLHLLLGGGILTDKTPTKTENGDPQITYYYNGIGTRDSKLLSVPLLGKLITKVQQYANQALAPTWGDARRILTEAMEDFVKLRDKEGYDKDNDILVVFGFSRGAALARKFVSKLIAEENCTVNFLGVFDTVAAMNGIHREGEKISSDVLFENGTLHGNVEKAVHIVSLDENRVPFTPTLINQTSEDIERERILEIWFPGVHSDIGGGYWHDGLSDLSLQFMINKCKKVLGDSIKFTDGTKVSAVKKFINDQKLDKEGITADDIIINGQVDGELHVHTSLLAKAGDLQPRLVRVWKNDRPSNEIPLIHHTVQNRFQQVAGYRPSALRGLPFNLLLANGERKPIQGIAGLH